MNPIYRNILIPVDGSQQSINAFKNGIKQSKVWDNPNIYLVQVIEEGSTETEQQSRLSLLSALEDYARKKGVKVHKELVFGDPRTQISETLVDLWEIELIIMGATGKSRMRKLLLGSVTTYVLGNAKCDVLVSR